MGKAEIGLGIAIFGISAKNYRGHRNSRPNPWLGGLFRGRLKFSVPNIVFSDREPCPIFHSPPLCENCLACRNVKFHLGNSHTKNRTAILKTKYSSRFFLFMPFWASPGPRVAGNGSPDFSSWTWADSQPHPCLGEGSLVAMLLLSPRRHHTKKPQGGFCLNEFTQSGNSFL